MFNQKSKIIVSSLLIALILASFMSVASFSASSAQIRSSVLRLHIRANSDSQEDQNLKLKVRDEILNSCYDIFSDAKNISEALEQAETEKAKIELAAKRVIAENGFSYPVKVEIGTSFFPTKTYENSVTLPAGEYMAVRVIIGSGEGHNWWCVMFPPLCVPAAKGDAQLSDVLTDDALKLTEKKPEYDVRFKIVEVIERLFSDNK
jgi:stage II sporulation protein R